MKKNLTLNPHSIRLFSMFSKNFDRIYSNLSPSNKIKILKFAPVIFRKWYYSTAIDETFLSPANLIECEFKKNLDSDQVADISLKITKGGKGKSKYNYILSLFSCEQHKFLDDLKCVVLSCAPDAELNDFDFFPTKFAEDLSSKLSSSDPFYIEYLTVMAFRLRLINKLPSIYSSRVQPAKNSMEFFNKPPEEAFKIIFKESLNLAAYKLTNILQLPSKAITPKILRSYIENPLPTEKIIAHLCLTIGINIESLWYSEDKKTFSDYEQSLITWSYFFGAMLEKWFFMPLGSYLKIIKPLYCIPFNYKEEINFVSGLLLSPRDISADFFTPCTFYTVSALGRKLLKLENVPDFQQIPESAHLLELFEAVNESMLMAYFNDMLSEELSKDTSVYTIKITNTSEKRYWKTMEIYSNVSFESLSSDINNALIFNANSPESFTYTLPSGKKAPLKLSEKSKDSKLPLSSIIKHDSDIFYYTSGHEPETIFLCEVIKIEKTKPGIVYPRILKQSKLFSKEDALYFY